MMDSSSTPNVSKPGSKKPRSRPQEEEESFRDRQIRMREEQEDAKAEQARLLRETEIKLPRHQKVFSLGKYKKRTFGVKLRSSVVRTSF